MKASYLIQYLTSLLSQAQILLEQFQKDRNPSSLHDFRTTIRKVRALSKFFLPESLHFPKTLQSAIKQTNEIRELDVLSEMLEKYPDLREAVFSKRMKRGETVFNEAFCDLIVHHLDDYTHQLLDTNLSVSAEETVSRTLRHYDRCMKQLHSLGKNERSVYLHKLRIKFKIARYALEFLKFAEMKPSDHFIENCKCSQDRLGKIQDLKTHMKWLKEFARENPSLPFEKVIASKKRMLKKLKGTIRSG